MGNRINELGKSACYHGNAGMAECLVIARKTHPNRHSGARGNPDTATRFVSLRRRPPGFAQAAAIARRASTANGVRRIKDGPYGGAYLTVGDDMAGEMLASPPSGDGDNWGSVRLLDYALAQTAYA